MIPPSEGVRRWTTHAPSNIALIKYMGKVEGDANQRNRPTNTSLSFTLPHLRSYVQLEYDSSFYQDTWEPLTSFGDRTFAPMELTEKGLAKFLGHLAYLKTKFDFKGSFKVRSANDFPSDCGLASSASAFAALTKAAAIALAELKGVPVPSVAEAANWSRLGSGSSCRSFFEPWSIWSPEDVHDVPQLARFGNLIHQVVVVNDKVKAVSSSDAHKRVTSSLLFGGRPHRADVRAADFVRALTFDKWEEAFEIAWAEFWDMHALFETSSPAFGYMTGGTLDVLGFVRDQFWRKDGMGPLVTMDAGPNVHLLFPNDTRGAKQANTVLRFATPRFKVFSSLGSSGPPT